MKIKKYLVIIGLVVLIVLTGYLTARSYGFFSAVDVKKNTFVMGNVKIGLTEPNWNDEDNPGKNLMPGKTIYKDPTLIGVEGESFARIILEFQDKDGNLITDQARIDLIKQTMYYDTTYNGLITSYLKIGHAYTLDQINELIQEGRIYNLYNIEYFSLDFERSTYNIYYFNYNNILVKNDKAVLMSNIAVPLDFVEEDIKLLGEFKLAFRAEAIQIAGFDARNDAYVALDEAEVPNE